MNRYILCCFIVFFQWKSGLAQQPSILSQTVHTKMAEGTVGSYLSTIANEGISLSYSNDQIKLLRVVQIKPGTYSVKNLLQLILKEEHIQIVAHGNKIVLYKSPTAKINKNVISGYVYLKNSREPIPYANINIVGTSISVSCNDYGFYSLELPDGKYVLKISHIGYTSQLDSLKITSSFTHHFQLGSGITLAEIKVEKKESKIWDGHTIIPNTATSVPVFLGQADPLRTIQMQSGVSGGTSGSNMLVRGGTTDQNLVLLDGAPVYNYSHFGDLLSIFNNDAVKHVSFYKGAFPSRYEGRLSSVIDVKMKEGNMEEFHGVANVGLLTSSAMVEGPILKQKVSFMSSIRRSWVDAITRAIDKDIDLKYYLYDANFKINYKIDSTTHLFLSTYLGSDRISLGLKESENPFLLQWGNALVSTRLNKVINNRLFYNTSMTFSRFTNKLITDTENNTYNQISDIALNNEINYRWNNNVSSYWGVRFNDSKFRYYYQNEAEESKTPRATQISIYSDNDVSISDRLKLRAGLHLVTFLVKQKNYQSFQPRSSLIFKVDRSNYLSASYAYMAQFYHQITQPGITIPNEFRAPSSANLPPEASSTYELGYRHLFHSDGTINIGIYSRNFKNILMSRPFQSLFDEPDENIAWQNRLLSGKGRSKGLEIDYNQKFKTFNIQASYTLSKATSSFAQINNGQYFISPNDIRNQFNYSMTMDLSSKWQTSFLFTYRTGKRITVPSYSILDLDEILENSQDLEEYQLYAEDIQNYKLKDNYSLNIGFSYTKLYPNSRRSHLRFGVNNLIGRPVPIITTTSIEDNQIIVNQVDPFKFLPYVGYTYVF